MEDWIQKCDSGFNLYHKTDLVTGGSIHKRTERFILMQENCGDIPEKVLKLFVKERTFHEIRLRLRKQILHLLKCTFLPSL